MILFINLSVKGKLIDLLYIDVSPDTKRCTKTASALCITVSCMCDSLSVRHSLMVWNWHRHKSDMKLKGIWHLGQEMRETKQAGGGVGERGREEKITNQDTRVESKGGEKYERRSEESERGSRNNDKQQSREKEKEERNKDRC